MSHIGGMAIEIGGFRWRMPILLRATGAVTYDEVRHVLAELIEDSRIEPGTPMLVDARGTTKAPTIGELASIAYHFRHLFARGVKRLAFITDNSDVEAAAKLFSAFVSTVGAESRAFQDPASADAWLKTAP